MARFSRWSLRHPLSLLGASLATVSGVLILFLLAVELTGHEVNPYLGLLVFLFLPFLLIAGLLLIPFGTWLSARRATRSYPVLDINRPSHRAGLVVFLALTAINLLLLSAAGFRGVEYMDSPAFCGQTCHQVMHPQHAAWQDSPHANVACVSCHVGPGARGFIRAKFNGVSQLTGVLTGNYERPIPSPVQNLSPARETCERCHWPQFDHEDRLKTKKTYLDDEVTTEQTTLLKLKIGGATGDGTGSGIHWHMNLANRVTYVPSDTTRQSIPWVRFTDHQGVTTEFLAPGASRPSEAEVAALGRDMDCVDCHNRPAHRFFSAEAAVDEALAGGRLPRDLPFMKKTVLAAVKEPYDTPEAAEAGIRAGIKEFYAQGAHESARARTDDIERAATEAVALYRRNVFPEMRIAWGAYPSMIGHRDDGGCFRCHDGQHVNDKGEAITNDCESCHTLLAVEESNPEILKQLNP